MTTLSAREAWDLATAEAKKWHDDAFTYGISQSGISAPFNPSAPKRPEMDVTSGRSIRWMVEFSRPTDNALLFIEVLRGSVNALPEAKGGAIKRLDLASDWIDSPEALRIANEETQLRIKESTTIASSSLTFYDRAFPSWILKYTLTDSTSPLWFVKLNARSGDITLSANRL